MAKLAKVARLELHPTRRGFLTLSCPYDGELTRSMRSAPPGVAWVPGVGSHWEIPEELGGWVSGKLHAAGFAVDIDAAEPLPPNPTLDPRLYPYQRASVPRMLADGRHLLNYEMGLGKTAAAIQALVQRKLATLIICPALVRRNWRDELVKWGGFKDEDIEVCESGKQAKAVAGPVAIISYELLPSLNCTLWDTIILDESHYIKTEGARRAKQVRALVLSNPQAHVYALTATPITSEPKDLWHQLDVLWPGRFGNYWQFARRYCQVSKNLYGTEVKGINSLYADELADRLKAVSSRTTKMEVAHLLPPFQVQTLRLPPVKTPSLRELNERCGSGLRKQHEMDAIVAALGDTKLEAACDQVETALASGATHVAVLCHFRDTGAKLAQLFAQRLDVPVVRVDGDIPIKERLNQIGAAKALPSAVLIATMHSVNVGIDLTTFTVAVFAELYWQPAAMVQALGRFSRLSGKLPSTVYLLVRQGSLDEPIAMTLLRRVRDQSKLWKPGQAEGAMLDEFDPAKMSDEEFYQSLRDAAAGRTEDEYL